VAENLAGNICRLLPGSTDVAAHPFQSVMSLNLSAAMTSASELVSQVESVVQSLTARTAELEAQLSKVSVLSLGAHGENAFIPNMQQYYLKQAEHAQARLAVRPSS